MTLKDRPVRPSEVYLEAAAAEAAVGQPLDQVLESPEDSEPKENSDSDERKRPKGSKHHNDKDNGKGKEARSKDQESRSKDKESRSKDKEAKRSASKLSSLSNQLVAHGYTKRALKLEGLSSSEQVHVSNIIADLLGASATKVSALEETNARLKTLQYEHERLLKNIDKNHREMARLETSMQAAKAQVAMAEHQQQVEEAKTKLLREDVARSRKALDNLKVAATQEAKRAQLKLDKVLAQLARQVPVVPPTFELMNPVLPGHIAPVAPGPIPLIESSLADLSNLRQSLQEEIEAFRHVAVSTANSLREALAVGKGEDPPPRLMADEFYALQSSSRHIRQVASWTAHPTIADTRLKALVADVRAALTAGVPAIMRDGSGSTEAEAELAEEVKRQERARQREVADLRDKVKDLEVELQIAAAKNEEANKVVEQMAKLSVHGGVPSTTDFEDSRLRDELVRQKRILDTEREALRERNLRLNEERLALDADKAAFAADKDAALAAAVAAAAAEAAEAAAAKAAAEAETQARATAIGSASPPRSPKQSHATLHHPPSPSPLSPHGKRTPAKMIQHHVATRRRAPRTPLSRLVLERAVLERDRRKPSGSGTGSSTGPGTGAAGVTVNLRKSALGASTRASVNGGKKASLPPAGDVLGDSARDNLVRSLGVAHGDKGKGKVRAEPPLPTSTDAEENPAKVSGPLEPMRKSSSRSLLAGTAASAAHAKGDRALSSSNAGSSGSSSAGRVSTLQKASVGGASGAAATAATGKVRAWR